MYRHMQQGARLSASTACSLAGCCYGVHGSL